MLKDGTKVKISDTIFPKAVIAEKTGVTFGEGYLANRQAGTQGEVSRARSSDQAFFVRHETEQTLSSGKPKYVHAIYLAEEIEPTAI